MNTFKVQVRREQGGTWAGAYPIFGAISSKTVVVPTQYLSPIMCVPIQYLIPCYGTEVMRGGQNLKSDDVILGGGSRNDDG